MARKSKANDSNTPKPTPTPSSTPLNSQTAPSNQPQYHYTTPIEDPAITQSVIQ
jgi:hypothetical protein